LEQHNVLKEIVLWKSVCWDRVYIEYSMKTNDHSLNVKSPLAAVAGVLNDVVIQKKDETLSEINSNKDINNSSSRFDLSLFSPFRNPRIEAKALLSFDGSFRVETSVENDPRSGVVIYHSHAENINILTTTASKYDAQDEQDLSDQKTQVLTHFEKAHQTHSAMIHANFNPFSDDRHAHTIYSSPDDMLKTLLRRDVTSYLAALEALAVRPEIVKDVPEHVGAITGSTKVKEDPLHAELMAKMAVIFKTNA